jgi:hypothetical protein
MNPTDVRPFIQTGSTVSIAATTTSGNVAISAPRPKAAELPGTVRVYNAGPDMVYIGQGATAPTVTSANGTPVPVGNTEVFQLLGDTAFVGAICPTSTATVYFTPGQGS